MSIIELMQGLNNEGLRVAVVGGRLQLSGTASDSVRNAIEEHQATLVAMLTFAEPDSDAEERVAIIDEANGRLDATLAIFEWERMRARDYWSDWRLEWITEVGMLHLAMRDAPQHVRARLQPLADATPANHVEWLELYRRIADVEHDLRQRGEMPIFHWPKREPG